MITFNMIALDLIIYGTRTVFHSLDLGPWKNGISALLLMLLIIDYSEIWILGSLSHITDIDYETFVKN